ncbi:1-aminocyclopropane-1-carboxylate synthase [Madurella fahalii]|uniref:1-aminocyclopropane-1-carboxylate synthase n=1 Tax=Madurella fahalii TaxID=1157608 RepID=A0ABQ0GPB1_9PEZI
MHREVTEFIAKNIAVDPVRHLTYGLGPKGSPRLRQALASFLNSHFRPREPARYEDMIILSGVTSVIDALAWSICNEGEGIIIPQPFYSGFAVDLPTRARAVVVPALFQSLEGYQGFDDIFDTRMNIKALEVALKGAEQRGITVRAVLLTNPHNPLGRCYPVETLKEIASFCGRHGLHLISDEIYANSFFGNPQAQNRVAFKSVLALDLADRIDSQLVHVTYGASKDFCANGLRLGMLYTRNQGLQAAIASSSMLAWPPNQQRLTEQYAFATQFLDEHGIPYYTNPTAGMFIWIDLRRYLYGLRGGSGQIPDLSVHRLSHEQEKEYRRREAAIGDRCFGNGVPIALGTNFFTEELGWFRLTFTAARDALEVGLQRLRKTLQDIKDMDWEVSAGSWGRG